MSSRRLDHDIDVSRVAYAVAKVIATKTIQADPGLRRLDALGRASAAHTMARNMAPMLVAEAEAAVEAVLDQLRDPEPALVDEET